MKPITMLDWALAYAAAGFAVVPVYEPAEDGATCSCEKGAECERPAKHPIPRQGIKQATTDPARIRVWWGESPNANIAIATGEHSNLIAIDVDTANGKTGDISLTQATADKGGVPTTLKARSGSGGSHYLYLWRKSPFTRKIGFLEGVDYLSDGGYVIVQPSRNLAGAYAFDPEAEIKTPGDIRRLRGEMAELPEWFDDLVGFTKGARKGKKGATKRGPSLSSSNRLASSFHPESPRWIEALREALTFCDPDSRELWILFGLILGREFGRNDDGWSLYEEWSARSSKFNERETAKKMRDTYYVNSQEAPQSGRAAGIGTILHHAIEGGWQVPVGGVGNERTNITYTPGRAIEVTDQIVAALSQDTARSRVYAFGSGLGEVIETHDPGAIYDHAGAPPNGWLLKVLAYSPILLGNRVTNSVNLVKWSTNNQPTVIECPAEVSAYMLANCGRRFARLNGIVQWPIVIDGKVVGSEADYDPKAGLLFKLPAGMDLSDLKGSRKEAEAAWRWVREIALADFPLNSPEAMSGALALLLTFMQRRALDTSPAFLISAPSRGTGKTALAKFASRVVHGRSLGAAALSPSDEEQRKAITAALVTNPPALLFDNLQAGSVFDSNELAIAMTSSEWEDRRLGSTERLTLPNRAVWCFTGNNVSVSGDLRRRVVHIRMVPQVRNHFSQHFSRNLETWPDEHRAEALRALATIALWGAREGPALASESGFPGWDRAVRRAVVGLTGVDPFRGATEEAEEEDPVEGAVGVIMTAWAAFMGGNKSTVREFVTEVENAIKGSSRSKRDLAAPVEDAVATIRGKEVKNLSPLDYGHTIKSLQDRLTLIADGESAFRYCGLRHKVATWQLSGFERIVAGLDGEF